MTQNEKKEIIKIHDEFKKALLFAVLDIRPEIKKRYEKSVSEYMDFLLNMYINADRQFQELAEISSSAAEIISEQRKQLDAYSSSMKMMNSSRNGRVYN